MFTLEVLQRLDDATFHRICDELIPRIDTRYFPLTPHGISLAGASIKGQPDSFVGESIATARIGISYSIQKRRWWTKLLDDVQKTRTACPIAHEVVWATSRDTEREENLPLDWLSNAEAACVPATLTVFGGRRLAHLLDTEHQDLRFQYLDIPHSRLSYESLVTACRNRTRQATQDLQASGRYDANGYVVRRADQVLFELWESCGRSSLARVRPRLIPMISGAGLGKTSLLCRFAESFSPGLPVLFVIARDMAWQAEDAIVRFVTQAAEGVLEPHVRSGEEKSIARLLRQRWPLTVVLDGLDETHEPTPVRRALRYWLTSPLAEESTLIVSSRPQFWALCEDATWGAWIPSDYRRVAARERDPRPLVLARGVGFSFPELLNARELEAAWDQGGRAASELAALSPDVRAELSHPFTLRAFLDLGPSASGDGAMTRASILRQWIDGRLRAEADAEERLTAEVYRRTLAGLAARLRDARGWVSIENLRELPTYDPARPPGRAIERLAAAGLVEISPSAMELRFGHESIADFFAGELDVSRAVQDPAGAANDLLQGTYSNVALRLEVIGDHVERSAPPSTFVDLLARADPARAILVMLGTPDAFDARVRAIAVYSLATEISGRLKARAGFAVELLGRFACLEARQALIDHLHPAGQCAEHLRSIGAMAVARATAADAADVAYSSPLFRSSEPYYFADILHVLRNSDDAFKARLAQFAVSELPAQQGSKEHIRATHVLAYLGDPRLVEHLAGAHDAGRELAAYENRALIAVGTDDAARLFGRSAVSASTKMLTLGWQDGGSARSTLFHSIATVEADLPHLMTPAFEELIATWLSSTSDEPSKDSLSRELKLVAIELARTSRSRTLARSYVVAKGPYSDQIVYEPVLDWLDPRDWSNWWREADERTKGALVRALPGVPTPAVEAALVEALRHNRMAWHAARYLGDCGTGLAKTALRQLVADANIDHEYPSVEVIRAVGKLRDLDAVDLLSQVARRAEGRVRDASIASLGLIGAPAAEAALVGLLDDDERVQSVAGGLVMHGNESAVRRAIDLSTADPKRGSKWLVRAVNQLLSGWGWRRGEYFTHIHDDFGTFILEHEPQFDETENLEYFRLLGYIDNPSIRAVLRSLAQRRGSHIDADLRTDDELHLSRQAYYALFDRGDSWALPELIRQCVGTDRPYARFMAERLLSFRREEVASAVRMALNESVPSSTRGELNRLLGFFGAPNDSECLRRDAQSADDSLANLSDEALLRLDDPLRLPDNWSTLRY